MRNTGNCSSIQIRDATTIDINKSLERAKSSALFRMTVCLCSLKGTVHPQMKILSSFIQPQVVPDLFECVCSEHKGRYFEESL